MLYYLLAVLAVLLVVLDRWKPEKFRKMHQQLGCDFLYVPIIGHCYILFGGERRVKNYLKIARQCYKNKHGMISFWFVNRLYVAITDPLQAKLVLKTCLDKGLLGRLAVDVLGNSTAFTHVEEWRHRRKVMGAVLAPRFVKNFLEIFSRQSEELCDKLASESLKGEFSVWEYFYGHSLDIIAEAASGINMKLKSQLHHPVLNAVEESMQNVMTRIAQPWQQVDSIYKLTANYRRQVICKQVLEDFTNGIISKKKIMIEKEKNITNETEQNFNKKTLMELMMEISGGDNGYNDVELLEEILVLVIGGTDTTTSSSGFLCVLLSLYPDVQEKVYEEIKKIVGNSMKPLTLEDLDKLVYLESVIKEAIRLYPSGPVILREGDKDVELPTGLVLHKDTTFVINIIGINRHPQYWGEDAEEFRPERFLEGFPTHPSAFMSFSYGPRNCAGQGFAMMSMKTLFFNILRRYRITPAACYENMKQVKVSSDVMLRPVHDFKVKMNPRF